MVVYDSFRVGIELGGQVGIVMFYHYGIVLEAMVMSQFYGCGAVSWGLVGGS